MGKIQDLAEATSREVRAAYERFMLGADGAWLAFANSLGSGPAYSRMILRGGLDSLAGAYTSLVEQLAVNAVTSAFQTGAVAAGGNAGQIPEGMLAEARHWPQAAIARDVRTLLLAGQQVVLRHGIASMHMPATLARQAALGELPSQQASTFVQLDLAGRRRRSIDYLDVGIRKTLVDAYAYGFTAALAAAGTDSFQAVNTDGTVEDLNLLTTWPAWSQQHMHPNTTWSLRPQEMP